MDSYDTVYIKVYTHTLSHTGADDVTDGDFSTKESSGRSLWQVPDKSQETSYNKERAIHT